MEFVNIIKDSRSTIGQKYQSFFELKHLNRLELLIEIFDSLGTSEYLRHEVVYIMGQMQPTPQAINFISNLLKDENEQPVVRHEAAEALGNFPPQPEITNLLEYYSNSQVEEVRDTCILSSFKHKTYNEKQKYCFKEDYMDRNFLELLNHLLLLTNNK